MKNETAATKTTTKKTAAKAAPKKAAAAKPAMVEQGLATDMTAAAAPAKKAAPKESAAGGLSIQALNVKAAAVTAAAGKGAGVDAVLAKKAAPKKVNKARAAKPAAEKKPAANGALSIHINKTGRVCFGKAAALRIGDLGFMTIAAEGKAVKMTARKDATEGALDINRANGRPYVSAMRLLKGLGFTGKDALDVEAKAVNGHGFEFKVA